jgi:Outer membrane lipoprotein carrier protein LolA
MRPLHHALDRVRVELSAVRVDVTRRLKEWVTRDAQGVDTRVEVSDLAKSVELDADLFKITPPGWVK